MFVVFDLDGTLANTDHRQKFMDGTNGKKDWRGFYAACVDDTPHQHVFELLFALEASGHEIAIWSGRSKEVEAETVEWLRRNGLGNIPLQMREDGDHTPDDVLKKSWLDAAFRKPDLILDDRDKVVRMWRDAGIPCCQVAPGDF